MTCFPQVRWGPDQKNGAKVPIFGTQIPLTATRYASISLLPPHAPPPIGAAALSGDRSDKVEGGTEDVEDAIRDGGAGHDCPAV